MPILTMWDMSGHPGCGRQLRWTTLGLEGKDDKPLGCVSSWLRGGAEAYSAWRREHYAPAWWPSTRYFCALERALILAVLWVSFSDAEAQQMNMGWPFLLEMAIAIAAVMLLDLVRKDRPGWPSIRARFSLRRSIEPCRNCSVGNAQAWRNATR